MDLHFTAEDLAFRDDVRSFLRGALPAQVRAQVVRAPSYVSAADTRAWNRVLYDRGWAAPNWPREHGGTGWSATRKHIFEQEYQAADCPRLSPFGLNMVGPVIYTYGSDAQKARHLPGILTGDVLWCQGYSEPGAGSDLASLKTRAVRDGDRYVVDGQKIWTSHAHHADMMFCLVRTDGGGRPQEGITFLLIDMATPGVEVRPIVSIDGGHYLNEVFFTGARVPVGNRIGEEGRGWTYAKFLLGHERFGIAGVGKSLSKVQRLKEIARLQRDGAGALAEDPAFRRRLAEIEARLAALEGTQLRMLAREEAGQAAGPEVSALKVAGTEIEQALNALMVEAMGYHGLPLEPEALRPEANANPVVPAHGLGVTVEHLLRRAASIYGGSNEIQRNLLAKRVLGL
ncbi:MAG: acyl-CoA dehydrogenase family protein [Sneathiellaceae bacterium]